MILLEHKIAIVILKIQWNFNEKIEFKWVVEMYKSEDIPVEVREGWLVG